MYTPRCRWIDHPAVIDTCQWAVQVGSLTWSLLQRRRSAAVTAEDFSLRVKNTLWTGYNQLKKTHFRQSCASAVHESKQRDLSHLNPRLTTALQDHDSSTISDNRPTLWTKGQATAQDDMPSMKESPVYRLWQESLVAGLCDVASRAG